MRLRLSRLELHPTHRNARYTLRGLFLTEAEAKRKALQLLGDGFDVYVYQEHAPATSDVYAVAARHAVKPTSRSGIPHEYSADWVVTRAAVDLLRRIMRSAKGERGRRWYKPLDVALLHRRVQGWSWKGTHLDVAAGIISDVVLAHPFPNANHRTSILLARSYLQACGITWPHYSLGAEVRSDCIAKQRSSSSIASISCSYTAIPVCSRGPSRRVTDTW